MKILIDIGHPAHVHYFRNAIRLLMEKGHEFLITTRDKEVTLDLLRAYGLPYICTGKNKPGFWKKFQTMIRNDIAIYRAARNYKPDLFLSFFSPFAAQVGWLMNKPVIGFTDTEFAKFSIRLTKPFTNYIFTPHCFETDFGDRHFRFKGYMENFYLHPNHFTPDASVLSLAGIRLDQPFFILRFVSFTAGHDAGESGIDQASKIAIAQYLAGKGRLIISAEGALPAALESYKMKLAPEHFHHLLAFASLYVGEGITTASESALLGTPAVLINTLSTGYIREQEKLGLVHRFDRAAAAIDRIKSLVAEPGIKEVYREKTRRLLQDQIDCTAFLTQLIDGFPESLAKGGVPPIPSPLL